MAGYLTEATHPWLFRRMPGGGSGAGNTFMQAFQIGANLKQRQLDNALRQRELEAKWKAMDIDGQLAQTKIIAQEQIAAGHAELGQILSEIGATGDWSNPSAKARFWATAAKHPQLMKDPSFKELTQTFELADQAKLRSELLRTQVDSRMDLETVRQQNRLEQLNTRLSRMADMKQDDQAFKLEIEGLLQEHRLERDRAKASTSGSERFDLNKSDEIAFRSKLASLQTALNQGVLELDEFERKRTAVIEEYKAKARTPDQPPVQPAATNSPAVKVFDPATGGFK